ncbi:MAG: hypothetical protein ACK5NT_07080 [Pyrinomonadaceae bacterium]
MTRFRFMRLINTLFATAILAFVLMFSGCPKNSTKPKVVQVPLRDVPAQRLNYRFETDVPAPNQKPTPGTVSGRDEKVQGDFDENRPFDVLDRTLASPDGKRVLAIYRNSNDLETEYRLDVYDTGGKLIKKITHEQMAVHFPGTVVWSPDSRFVSFVAMSRGFDIDKEAKDKKATGEESDKASPEADVNANTEANVVPPVEDEEPPPTVLTFKTEQIYLCNSEGADLKPLTQTEGLIYFYMAWAPDSGSLVALASPITEWKFREFQMAKTGEVFLPAGRPRLLEKNGRERLLDDFSTPVHPVWSPDSAKIAVAFDKQIRIYDAVGDRPTQAAIPLRNQLLLAAKAYEEKLRSEEGDGNANAEANAESNVLPANSNTEANGSKGNIQSSTLPDADSLVSFNPIVDLVWETETNLYFETGYVKNFVENESENRRSYMRWHRLILSAQQLDASENQQ